MMPPPSYPRYLPPAVCWPPARIVTWTDQSYRSTSVAAANNGEFGQSRLDPSPHTRIKVFGASATRWHTVRKVSGPSDTPFGRQGLSVSAAVVSAHQLLVVATTFGVGNPMSSRGAFARIDGGCDVVERCRKPSGVPLTHDLGGYSSLGAGPDVQCPQPCQFAHRASVDWPAIR